MVEVAGEVAVQTGQRALPVHAVVLGEPLVLDRHDRQLHRVGDLIGGHLEPALRCTATRSDSRPRRPSSTPAGRHPREAAPSRWRRRRRRGWTTARCRPRTGTSGRRHHPGQQTAPRQLDDRYPRRPPLRHAYRVVLLFDGGGYSCSRMRGYRGQLVSHARTGERVGYTTWLARFPAHGRNRAAAVAMTR